MNADQITPNVALPPDCDAIAYPGANLAIPGAPWMIKSILRGNQFWPADGQVVQFVRHTFFNEDPKSPFRLLSIATNATPLERIALSKSELNPEYREIGEDFAHCKEQGEFAMAHIGSVDNFIPKLTTVPRDYHPFASFLGYWDGVIDLLNKGVDVAGLGNDVIKMELEIGRKDQFFAFYTFAVRANEPGKLDRSSAEMHRWHDWLTTFGEQALTRLRPTVKSHAPRPT